MKPFNECYVVWIWIGISVLLPNASYGDNEFNIDEFVMDCISYNEVIRNNALTLLASDAITGSTKTKILQKIPLQLFQSKPSVELLTDKKITGKNRLRLYGHYVKHEAEILQRFSAVDHPAAKDFVLCNLDYNRGFWAVFENGTLFGIQVNSYEVPRYVLADKVIQLKDIISFITDPISNFNYPEHYEALLMFCMISPLTQKGFSWEEAKGIIKDEINKKWDSSIPAQNKSQERVIQVILQACNDPNFTGYEHPSLERWSNIINKK